MGLAFEFALVLLYNDAFIDRDHNVARGNLDVALRVNPGQLSSCRVALAHALMVIFAFVGGCFTASVGSGSDMALFVFGKFVWNVLLPHRHLSNRALASSSVVTMGAIAAIVSVARAVSGNGISLPAVHCWAASAWVVCIGAPIGSLVLSENGSGALQHCLRVSFYALSLTQLYAFALHVEQPRAFWTTLGVITAIVFTLAMVHNRYCMSQRHADGDVAERMHVE